MSRTIPCLFLLAASLVVSGTARAVSPVPTARPHNDLPVTAYRHAYCARLLADGLFQRYAERLSETGRLTAAEQRQMAQAYLLRSHAREASEQARAALRAGSAATWRRAWKSHLETIAEAEELSQQVGASHTRRILYHAQLGASYARDAYAICFERGATPSAEPQE